MGSIQQLLSFRRLVPKMNNTKWRELAYTLSRDFEYQPSVRIKYLNDESVPAGFAPVWWDQVEAEGFELIEWLEIRTVEEIITGRLTPPVLHDQREIIKAALEKYAIPYVAKESSFLVYGY